MQAHPDATAAEAAAFYVELTSWIPGHLKNQVLAPDVVHAASQDQWLHHTVEQMFATTSESLSAIDQHARVQGRINLTGLLGRLDSSTMLASIEGRTPFADINVARHAMSISMQHHAAFDMSAQARRRADGTGHGAGTTAPPATMGKRLLRSAYEGVIPPSVIQRPKQSFPIPFQGWIGDHVAEAAQSSTVQQVFRPEAVRSISAAPAEHWNLTWPMTNVMLWLGRFFH